jgi:cytoskeleton protein RodZ
MTDELTPKSDGKDSAPSAGERLAEARRAREISIGEVARELHLDEPKVRALEENAFEALGAPVFAKGYLRRYAEVVGVPADDILADYYRLNRATAAPPIVGRREKPPRDASAGPWMGVALVVIVAAGAAWWWSSGGKEWFVGATEPATLAPSGSVRDRVVEELPVEDEPPPQAATDDVETGGDDVASGDPADAAPADLPVTDASRTEEARTAVPVPGEVEISINFSGDCWTEITDATGVRLYFGLGTAGRTVTVAGEPPLQVLLGDSDNASMSVNGSSYPVPPSARRGDTARMTIMGR